MSRPLANVTAADLNLEGGRSDALHDAVVKVCPEIVVETLWAGIRDLHELGYAGNVANWLDRMNEAIGMWNLSRPKSEALMRLAFGLPDKKK